MAEKQSHGKCDFFASNQKRVHVKLVLSCCTAKPGHGTAWMSAEAISSLLSCAPSLSLICLSHVLQSQPR